MVTDNLALSFPVLLLLCGLVAGAPRGVLLAGMSLVVQELMPWTA